MKKNITSAVLVAALFVVPALTLAASYHYIDLNGKVQTVEASNPNEALMIASNQTAAVHTGVKLDQGLLEAGVQAVGGNYAYVDTSGSLKVVTAASVEAAMVLASDRHPDSGFWFMGQIQ